MNSTASEVLTQRIRAAELSKGTSLTAIYQAIERTIEERNLGGAVLDYGAGVGELTRRLAALDRFHSISAADIMQKPPDLEKVTWIEQDLNDPISGYAEAFDLIISAEVIEHLENPRFTMREIYRMLRPGGTAIVTTPNNESLRSLVALVVRGHFVQFSEDCYPAHITALLRKDLTRIFLECKLSEPVFYFTDHGRIPGWPRMMWQQVSLGVLRGLHFSDNLLAVATKIP
jgi:2-polyprenyl-3-methyl-5-hydroxy-6-metoxy-1,4-benzoquinol methylase